MSEIENTNDLNDEVLVEVDESEVITVPIDDTLSNSGEAADAKAVGDALELKADKSELQAAVTVNGQAADQQGVILLYAGHIPMSDSSGAESVRQAVEELQAMDAGDLPLDGEATGGPSVQEAIEDLRDRSGADIDLTEDPADGTIGEALAAVIADFTDAEILQMLEAAGFEEA